MDSKHLRSYRPYGDLTWVYSLVKPVAFKTLDSMFHKLGFSWQRCRYSFIHSQSQTPHTHLSCTLQRFLPSSLSPLFIHTCVIYITTPRAHGPFTSFTFAYISFLSSLFFPSCDQPICSILTFPIWLSSHLFCLMISLSLFITQCSVLALISLALTCTVI